MRITRNGTVYLFRECDVKGLTREEVQARADQDGRMQYEPRHAWLIIPGIGYGMEEHDNGTV